MNDKFINSTLFKNQPLLWRQAVTNSDNRGWNFINILLFFFKRYKFKYKNTPSILLDYLIVGSNPILNTLLLEKLIYQANNKDKLRIGIIINEQPDYWGYEIVNDSLFFYEISKNRKEISTVEEFYCDIFEKINKEKVDVIVIDEKETFIKYVTYDSFVNGWLIHLFRKEKEELTLTNNTIIQNDIKYLLLSKLQDVLGKFGLLKKIHWLNRDKICEPIILSKKIFLTSLPQGWISCEHSGIQNDKDVIVFEHDLINCSYGTAKQVMSSERKLKKAALNDIVDLIKEKNLNKDKKNEK